ncbi:DNA-binding response regulator, OmpR family, contains REC and winged-helix (wHTH) domain [Clostridium cavendishii DSM 21758]|uniref:Stage 0 sporulation protein A homolog n=1 Tax=Clostridium cavendishii DSM 21758 TaxID=1121302 RepID=A0A1M6HYL7_9CLOT|nr:response regulator transcription factor [Clostridium cavendishii]SHJ27349.1 DNA-binding response regulator, OmpR family, contains REC and winged-helix (wHTH) domain [Clostridium cavendishii DSM 21758]
MKDKILVVDDDRNIVDFLSIFLTKEGYEIVKAYDGREAIKNIENDNFSIILMDVMMPNMDGFEAITKIREVSEIPIIFLTARESQQDKIKGFISGCDDYITKPFDLVELSLRIAAMIKRTKINNEEEADVIKIVDLSLNLKAHTLFRDEVEIKLTPKEFEILSLLARNKDRIFSSEEIYERVWGEKFMESDNSLLTHVRNLREKLNDTVKNSKYIKTVWGVGYKIEKED